MRIKDKTEAAYRRGDALEKRRAMMVAWERYLLAPASNVVVAAIAEKTQATIVYPSMPVQDAIRLADFLVDTTKGFVSFLPGADTVGGDTDVAVVTKHEGFKWIRRKHYYRRELNPLETDHA